MSKPQLLFGFHAVRTRLRSAPASVKAIYVETTRHDKRMQDLLRLAAEFKLSVHQVDGERLDRMAGTSRHQGVVAQADTVELARSLDDLLDALT
ncbi:MAG TPA: RNA methyltransferase substrate-binding domain-containing protein, partial [Burkholderiaceae bacterium]|nr:RNA methyltransferase substrate-binding domain-containing protein [Burkholderiaceae bacterium]